MNRYQPVRTGNTELGAGRPKICVPVVAENREQFERALEILREEQDTYDLIEWRADIELGARGEADIAERIGALRKAAPGKAILFTIRTSAEGGNADLSFESYADKCIEAANYADLVDIELFAASEEKVRSLAEKVHAAGRQVIMSSHDFEKTPARTEMTGRLVKMQELGADVTKLAVMPRSEEDVLSLLAATVQMKTELADRPFITMSMGSLGRVSRLCGSLTGSALTFASAGKASAPGQVEAEKLKAVLELLG